MATSSKTPTIKEIEKRLDVLTQTVQRCEGMRQVNGVWVSTCVTCGRVLPCFGPNCMQGGHAIPRGCRITRWLPEVVHCQCVTGDTVLLTHNYKEVRQDEVKVGDAIMGFDEKTLNPVIAEVEHIETEFRPTITIELDNGKRITGTYDHRVMTDRGWATLQDIVTDSSYDIITV